MSRLVSRASRTFWHAESLSWSRLYTASSLSVNFLNFGTSSYRAGTNATHLQDWWAVLEATLFRCEMGTANVGSAPSRSIPKQIRVIIFSILYSQKLLNFPMFQQCFIWLKVYGRPIGVSDDSRRWNGLCLCVCACMYSKFCCSCVCIVILFLLSLIVTAMSVNTSPSGLSNVQKCCNSVTYKRDAKRRRLNTATSDKLGKKEPYNIETHIHQELPTQIPDPYWIMEFGLKMTDKILIAHNGWLGCSTCKKLLHNCMNCTHNFSSFLFNWAVNNFSVQWPKLQVSCSDLYQWTVMTGIQYHKTLLNNKLNCLAKRHLEREGQMIKMYGTKVEGK